MKTKLLKIVRERFKVIKSNEDINYPFINIKAPFYYVTDIKNKYRTHLVHKNYNSALIEMIEWIKN